MPRYGRIARQSRGRRRQIERCAAIPEFDRYRAALLPHPHVYRAFHPFAATVVNRVHEQLDGAKQKAWRRALQGAKRETAQEGEAEVRERLTIDSFVKFSFPHRLCKARA